VVNYVDFDEISAPFCAAPDGRRDNCGPEDFAAQPDRLYRNEGDGTFTDVSIAAGINLSEDRGLGVLIGELTGDNRPEATFQDVASASRAVVQSGNSWAWACRGHLDGDGRPDVVVNALDALAALLRNVSQGNHYLNSEIIDRSDRPAI
jgi:hypothetical protein